MKQTMDCSFQLIVFVCTVNELVVNGFKFRKVSSYDNLARSVTKSWSFGETPSVTYCAVVCDAKTGCFNFFYNHDNGSCTGIDDLNMPDPSSCGGIIGNNLYRMEVYDVSCGDDTDCSPTETNLRCRDGRCKCADFFNLIPDKRVCVATCDAYGETFEVYSDIYSHTFLLTYQRPITFAACRQHCIDDTRCRSLNYIEALTPACWTSAYTFLTRPENKRSYDGAVHAQRNCE